MQLLAHRGYHAICPENTLEAFSAALHLGFAGIETDVRVSADNEAVLFHNRVSKDGVPVAALTRKQLSETCGYTVPTLEEALQAFPNTFWNIEIKTPAAANLALPILSQYEETHRLLVTSFRHEIVLAAAELLSVECGFLSAHRPATINSLVHTALPYRNLRTLIWDCEIVDPDILRQTNALGFHNAVYAANTAYEHTLMREFGVYALITDFPQHVGLLNA
ncbi:glycerophosphodiester phosphodiesterase [Chitinimonas sp. BJB300]|uniref:glycerophosphodiester phosphodiesterase n=1 Tax=Chitinimonas sp. BJB300 TaxID=1559339 RepID=UPI000C10C050|nr:glycerophosphodiester phosphodiesterase [Chitinimonas sp. BJB300]PHV10831.1 glycerophosphodiester phosphodiesterase [Chitinimonas sp. BJB300]TSJ87057.1 glycerophosphodiester phosphodiesterase [Chitinimonas sp. BJB300]